MKKIYVVLLMSIGLITPLTTRAYSVQESYSDIQVCAKDTTCNSGKYSTVRGYEASIVYLDIKKNIDVVLPDGGIAASSFYLGQGQAATVNVGNTTGNWEITGGWNDTPPADGIFYNVIAPRSSSYTNYQVQLAASIPLDKTAPVYTSSNSSVVSCSANICTGVGAGVANITVSFPNVPIKPDAIRDINPGNTDAFGLVSFDARWKDDGTWKTDGHTDSGYVFNTTMFKRYKLPSFTYTVTVIATSAPVVNSAQVTTCAGISNIDENYAKLNWAYGDADGDAQTGWSVQVSTDPNFSTTNYQYGHFMNNGGNNNADMTGLLSGTTYYARVKTYNNVNGLSSSYSNCGSFVTKTSPPPPTSGCSLVDNIGPNSGRVNWTYSSSAGKSQTQYKIELSTVPNFSSIVRSYSQTPDDYASGAVANIRSQNMIGLNSNTTYYVRTSTYDQGVAWTAPSSCGGFTTLNYAIPVIASCNVSDITPTSAKFTWTYTDNTYLQKAANLILSENYYSSSTGSSAGGVSNETQNFTSMALKPNTKYYTTIKGLKPVSANGTNLWSVQAECTAFTTPPDTSISSTCSIGTLSTSTATINWTYTDNTGGTKPQRSYWIIVSPDPTFETGRLLQNVESASARSVTFSGLDKDRLYYTGVYVSYGTLATNGPWTKPSGCDTFQTTGDSIPQPTNLSASCSANGQTATFSWSNGGGYTRNYFRAIDQTLNTTATFLSQTPTTLFDDNATSPHVINNTIPGHKYIWWVRTINGLGQTSYNATQGADLTCPSTPPPTEPTSSTTIEIVKTPSITLNKGGQCVLNWEIKNKPTGMVCKLSGGSSGNRTIADKDTYAETLQQNTKYTITCTKTATPPISISSSVICRVNPTAGEI